MEIHPINGMMSTVMESIKEMVDVNTIVGDPVTTPDGMVIIPISKVSFGFASGGGEFNSNLEGSGKFLKSEDEYFNQPFAGGSGAGVSISPIAFLVVGQGNIKLLPVNESNSFERLIEYAPELINKITSTFKKSQTDKTQKMSDEV